jgi:hypothetical protein
MAYTFSRQALYDLVWAEPKTALATKFGVSDVWLSKICRGANIPIPPRGYWAKIAAHKKPPKIALPARDLGEIDEVTVGHDRWGRRSDEEIAELPPPPSFVDSLEAVTAEASKRLGRLSIARTLANPHRLIAELLQADDQRRKEAEGKTFVWDKPLFDEPTARRRLKILNALFLMLSKGGFRPSLRGKLAEEPGVTVGHFNVSFKLEKINQRSRPANRSPGRPKEPLQLEISNWTRSPTFPKSSWRDSDSVSLEDQLSEIVVNLVVAGEMLYRGDVLWRYDRLVQRKVEQEERIRAAKEKAERDEEERRQAELERRREGLAEAVENRARAEGIRDLVKSVEAHRKTTGEVIDLGELENWRVWALAEADRLDPLCSPLAELF